MVLGSLLALLAACQSTAPVPPQAWDGLEYRAGPGGASLYVQPGFDASGYRRVLLELPVMVPDASWRPDVATIPVGQGVAVRQMSPTEMQQAKDVVTQEVRSLLGKNLRQSGFETVDEAGAGTVRVTTLLVDVCLDGTYCGRMTAVMELRDASTGTVLARAVDQKTAFMGSLAQPHSVTDNLQFQYAVDAWARLLGGLLGGAER